MQHTTTVHVWLLPSALTVIGLTIMWLPQVTWWHMKKCISKKHKSNFKRDSVCFIACSVTTQDNVSIWGERWKEMKTQDIWSPWWLCVTAGGEPNHQLPSVSGAACRGWETSGPLCGNLCESLPLVQWQRRAVEASGCSGWCREPGSEWPAAARPPLRQLWGAHRTLRPGNRHHHECDREHFHLHGWCRSVQTLEIFSVKVPWHQTRVCWLHVWIRIRK